MPEITDTGNIRQSEWKRTEDLRKRLRYNPLYEEPTGETKIGSFAGRHIIARDTKINGGVYLGAGVREAIVVDDEKYPQELDQVYKELSQRMKNLRGVNLFTMIHDITREKMGRNQGLGVEKEVDNLVRQLVTEYGPDTKIRLNKFLEKGIGVCRHRALLAGYLIERLVNEGVLKGKVSIDRSTIYGKGGHAWVRWEGSGGEIIIIDPSIGFVGKIENAPKVWDYKRPGE